MTLLPRLALALPRDERLAKWIQERLPVDEVEVRPVRCPRPGSGSRLEIARRMLDEGEVDGLVLVEDPITGPLLRVRDGVRVVEAYPGLTLQALLERALPKDLARIARNAHDLLHGFGIERPRLTLFDVPGLRGLDEARRLAKAEGVDLRGPFAPSRVAEEGGDALLALTRDQVELPLALAGSGPETRLSLERPFASAPADPVSVAAAVRRLAAVVHVWGTPLAAERDAARSVAASVSVARRAKTRRDAGRCPYCHRLLTESADGALGSPGPPVVCSECGTGHHRDCLHEHGQCTVLGCKNTTFTRLGFELQLAQLGPADPVRAPFVSLEGDAGLGPLWLRVEAPIDDPTRTPARRELTVEVGRRRELRRGELVQGYVVVHAPRPFQVRGGILRLRATLTTQKVGASRNTARTHPILARQASLVGDAPASALGRLQDNVVSLFGGKAGVTIPAGIRRYPFSFRVHERHPKTVRNEHGGTVESVNTSLEALLDTHSAFLTLEIQ